MMINDHGGGLQAYDDDDSMYNWVDDDTAMSMRVVQDYSGWASYMGAGAILCCLASALAGIILKVSFYVFFLFIFSSKDQKPKNSRSILTIYLV